jgi:hypothetical protein
VVVGPAAIAHIANFNLDVLVNLRSPLVFIALLLLLLLAAPKQIVEVWLWRPKSVETVSNSLNLLFSVGLSLLDNSLFVNCKSSIFNILGGILH